MAQLQSSDMTAQLNKAVAPYWKAAAPYWKAVAPHVQTAQDKLAGVHKVVRPHLNTIVVSPWAGYVAAAPNSFMRQLICHGKAACCGVVIQLAAVGS